MKKILVVLLFFIFIRVDDIFAKEIIVNNIKYDDGSDFEGNGYKFKSNNKILYLDGYNGGAIIYDDLIEIRINNVNIINCDGKIGIEAKEIDIYGEGILNIYNGDIGINSERVQIQWVKLYIAKCKTGMFLIGNELYLYRNETVIEECNTGIYSPNSIVLVYSKMNIINCEFGIYNENSKRLVLNKSDLYIYTQNYCLYNIGFIDITLSRIVLKSENFCLNQKYNHNNDDIIDYVSEDDINYFIDDKNIDYPFIKISNNEYIDNLLLNDKNLIIEIDKSFLLNKDDENQNNNDDNQNDLNVQTKSEYTEDEYSKIEVINPQTIDNIHLFIILIVFSIFIIIVTLSIRSENE